MVKQKQTETPRYLALRDIAEHNAKEGQKATYYVANGKAQKEIWQVGPVQLEAPEIAELNRELGVNIVNRGPHNMGRNQKR